MSSGTASIHPRSQQIPFFIDMRSVSRFLDNATRIFEAAESAVQSGQEPSEVTILIGAEGGIRMIADSDWPLDSLQTFHAAQMAYRVSREQRSVRVQGRSGRQRCLFETARPNPAPRHLLLGVPQYVLGQARNS